MALEKLRQDIEQNKISLSDAIVKALSELKEKENDKTMAWLANELQGYSNPLNFYYQPKHDFPEYRVVNGFLKLMTKEGTLVNLEHSLANRSDYFLSVPISWLEEAATLPGETRFTEMPEFSHDISSGQGVVVQYSGSQLQTVLQEVKNRLLALLK